MANLGKNKAEGAHHADGVWRGRNDAQARRLWDELVVYHEPSGDVHVLSPLAQRVLALVESAPRTGQELVEQVSREMSPQEAAASVAALLEAMDEAGLIEKALC
ncbi:MAG: HPr-rel-A system PqqD family peptide chaperone [Desulfosoma sp.]|uniref:HPr-rel-A system PqqD family peptide chaperone n=1 Tax=Desulfosoma sp. TaxID=2603217 RepID=UPI00404B9C9B